MKKAFNSPGAEYFTLPKATSRIRFCLLLALVMASGVLGLAASPICSSQPACDPNYYIYNSNGQGTYITSTNIPINAVNLVICVDNSTLYINRNQTFTNCTFIFKSSGNLFLIDPFNSLGSRYCVFDNCCLMGDQGSDWPGILAEGEWRVEMLNSYVTNSQDAFRLQTSPSGFRGYLSMLINGSKFINNNFCLKIQNNGGIIDIYNSEFINSDPKYNNLPTRAMTFGNSNVYINESKIQNFESGILLSQYRSNLNVSRCTLSAIRKNAIDGDISRCNISVYNSNFNQIGFTAIKNSGPIEAVDNTIDDTGQGIVLSMRQAWPVSFYLVKNNILARQSGISLSNCKLLIENGSSIVSDNKINLYPNAEVGINITNSNMPGGILVTYDTIFTYGSGINIKMANSVFIEKCPILIWGAANATKSGISLSENSSNCFLLNNGILSLSPNITCITNSYSTENQLCCNKSAYGRFAFRVSGPSKMNWRSSEFLNTRPSDPYPVLLDAVASIGIQVHPGNQWLYPLSQTAFEAYNENPNFRMSRIFVDDIPIENPRTIPAGWFFPEDTSSPHCQTPTCDLSWTPSRKRLGIQKDLDRFVIDSTLIGPFATQQKDWYIRQLYERYFEDSLTVIEDEDLHNYVLNHQNEDLFVLAGFYHQIDKIIYQSTALTQLKSAIQRSKFIFDSLSALRLDPELNIFQIFTPQAIDLLTHSNDVVDSLAEHYINSTSAGLNAIKNQLSILAPSHYWAQQDKIYINHYIDLFINGFETMDAIQFQNLSTLAAQCPLISGDVCFKAADILRLFGHDVEVNTDYSCLIPEENHNPQSRNHHIIKNHNKNIQPYDDMMVSVYDLSGKTLARCRGSELMNKLCGLVPTHTVLIIKDQYHQNTKMIMPLCTGQ